MNASPKARKDGRMNDIDRISGIVALILTTACSFLPTPTAAEDKPEEPASFFEAFDAFSPERWFISNGWTNGPHQNCTWSAKNFRVWEGALELILRKNDAGDAPPEKAAEARQFSCAELQTHQTYGYGTYEVRASAAAAPGLVSAFFTYIGPTPAAQNPHDEIDFEFLGKDKHAVQLNYFGAAQGDHEMMAPLGFDASETMADYAFEWLPGSIRWFINGKLVHEAKAEPDKPFPKTPGKIYLSLWGSDTLDAWLGTFAYPGKPLIARFEWLAFTKTGESCRFPQSVLCPARKPGEAAAN
jgi:endo-1,3-1,4-beta-glycanase ExoK